MEKEFLVSIKAFGPTDEAIENVVEFAIEDLKDRDFGGVELIGTVMDTDRKTARIVYRIHDRKKFEEYAWVEGEKLHTTDAATMVEALSSRLDPAACGFEIMSIEEA